ncbi:MAG: undecaprenyldiphospho-muramoylpentapeptide beta-N-acetylglucosaminyltransferase [Bacteroidetes bacterium]|nr:undecaprenyldiphospho-muramoylpentapeptide beta-N-acetylglucosaminyltransferase [Bacteroidota bacterium]
MQEGKYKIIISGGGTGGHIFPAIAIANALEKKLEQIEILFIGAKGRMEMEKVPEAGYAIEGLWISGLQRKLTIKNFLVPLKLVISLIKANIIISRFKPAAAVGVGGYASGPTLRVAAWKGIPTLIQEQNSYPGITNKLLAKKTDRICVAYEGMERFFPKEKIIITGNPIREDMVDTINKKDKALEFFGLERGKRTLLVIGGSQGAVSVNESIAYHLKLFSHQGMQVIWQTGKLYYPKALELVSSKKYEGVKVQAFITRMDYAYAVADVVISRAGAITVSELCAVRKPVIFIPLPTAAEDHQTKNAMALVHHEAALMITDSKAKVSLGHTVSDLIADTLKCAKLAENIGRMAQLHAADRIADEIIGLINRKKKNSQ